MASQWFKFDKTIKTNSHEYTGKQRCYAQRNYL